MKTRTVGFILTCVTFCLLGCGSSQNPQQEGNRAEPNDKPVPVPGQQKVLAEEKPDYMVQVTPVDFFSGDLKRLRHHLDYGSAVCFKIKAQGNVWCDPSVEMWHEGKRIDDAKYGFGGDDGSDEVSFTVRLGHSPAGKISYQASVGGMVSFRRTLEKPDLTKPVEVEFGPVSLERPIELKPGSNSAVVWAMGGGDGVHLSESQEKVEQELKRLPWVMILRLRFEARHDD